MPAIKDKETGKFVSPDKAKAGAANANAPAAKTEQAISTPALDEMSKRYLGEKPTDQPVKLEEKKVEEKPPVEKKPAPAAKKPAAPAQSATDTLLARTTDVLEKVAEKFSEKPPSTEEGDKKKADDVLADLSPKEKRKVAVLQQMEKDFEDRPEYKGIATKFIEARKKFKAYLADWQTKHPGETFDDEAEEHEGFFRANDVDWEDEDYIEALTNMKAGAAIEERHKTLNSKLSEVERAQKVIKEQPNIVAEGVGAARAFWKSFDETLADMLSETGVADGAKLAELYKSNPSKYRAATGAAQRVETLTGEMYKLVNRLEVYQPENKTHKHLVDFAITKEKNMAARPPEDQKDAEGRLFKPRIEYLNLPAEEQKKFWTFTASDFGFLIAAEEANRVKSYLEEKDKEFREEAAARGIKFDETPAKGEEKATDVPAKTTHDDPDDEELQPDNSNGKPRSPSSVSAPKVAASQGKSAAGATNAEDAFMKRYLNKS
jgi:hypothetical protein